MKLERGLYTYSLKIDDLLVLPDGPRFAGKSFENVAILLGNAKKGKVDCLLSSREKLVELQKRQDYVETEIYFQPVISSWNLLLLFIGKLRKRFKVQGTNSYHIRPEEIKEKGLIRCVRTRENAYKFTQYYIPDEKRHELYDDLEKKIIQNGWDPKQSDLSIMLCRSFSYFDSLDDGNHRVNICLEHKVPEVTVKFRYAGKLPTFISNLFIR